MEKMSVVCEISGADEKCELLLLRCAVLMQNLSVYYMHLLYKMDDINTKVGICLKFVWNCFEKVSIVDEKCDKMWEFVLKSEYCWWKIWAFVFPSGI